MTRASDSGSRPAELRPEGAQGEARQSGGAGSGASPKPLAMFWPSHSINIVEAKLLDEAHAFYLEQWNKRVATPPPTSDERLRKALEEILALDGAYCDSCHSDEIGQAFRIARRALSAPSTPASDALSEIGKLLDGEFNHNLAILAVSDKLEGEALTLDLVRGLLFHAVGKSSLTRWCKDHGINRHHASEFVTGGRGPGGDLLKALGLEYRLVRITGHHEPVPPPGPVRAHSPSRSSLSTDKRGGGE